MKIDMYQEKVVPGDNLIFRLNDTPIRRGLCHIPKKE